MDRRHELARDQPVPGGQLLDDRPPRADVRRRVDRDHEHRDTPPQTEDAIGERLVVRVEAADGAEHGHAGCAGRVQAMDELEIYGMAPHGRGLLDVDHHLLPDREAGDVALGDAGRCGETSASRADRLDPLDRDDRVGDQRTQRSDRRAEGLGGPDREQHQRDVRVASEEPGAASPAVERSVDTEQDLSGARATLSQEIDRGDIPRLVAGADAAARRTP